MNTVDYGATAGHNDRRYDRPMRLMPPPMALAVLVLLVSFAGILISLRRAWTMPALPVLPVWYD